MESAARRKDAPFGQAAMEIRLRTWMIQALAGDREALRRLLNETSHHLRVYFARRLPPTSPDVEDLVQETLLAIHAKRDTYDPNRPFTPWIYAVGRYKLADHLRRQRRRPTVSIELFGDIRGSENLDEIDHRTDLDRMLGALPAQRRRLVEDIKILGLSVPEAAERSGVSPVSARVIVHRCLKQLGEAYRLSA